MENFNKLAEVVFNFLNAHEAQFGIDLDTYRKEVLLEWDNGNNTLLSAINGDDDVIPASAIPNLKGLFVSACRDLGVEFTGRFVSLTL